MKRDNINKSRQTLFYHLKLSLLPHTNNIHNFDIWALFQRQLKNLMIINNVNMILHAIFKLKHWFELRSVCPWDEKTRSFTYHKSWNLSQNFGKVLVLCIRNQIIFRRSKEENRKRRNYGKTKERTYMPTWIGYLSSRMFYSQVPGPGVFVITFLGPLNIFLLIKLKTQIYQ